MNAAAVGDARERGSALVAVLVLLMAMTFAALTTLGLSNTNYVDTVGRGKIDRASAIADVGLAYLCEVWRRGRSATTPVDELAFTDQGGDGVATTAAEQNGTPKVVIGTPIGAGDGRFTLVSIQTSR